MKVSKSLEVLVVCRWTPGFADWAPPEHLLPTARLRAAVPLKCSLAAVPHVSTLNDPPAKVVQPHKQDLILIATNSSEVALKGSYQEASTYCDLEGCGSHHWLYWPY